MNDKLIKEIDKIFVAAQEVQLGWYAGRKVAILIDSCETPEQLKVATKLADNLCKMYPTNEYTSDGAIDYLLKKAKERINAKSTEWLENE